MRVLLKNSLKDFLDFYVDVFQVLNIEEEFRISRREKDFLVTCIMMHYEGYDLGSSESVDEISKRMNFNNKKEVYTYRLKLKKKGYIQQTKESIELPKAFLFKKIPSKLTFQFAIENKDVSNW